MADMTIVNKKLMLAGLFLSKFGDAALAELGFSSWTAAVRPSDVFSEALKAGAASIIVAHNHPGGSLVASPQDRELTTQLTSLGNLLRVPLREQAKREVR